MEHNTATHAEVSAGWSLRKEGVDIFRGLMDVQMRTILTTTMAPTIYVCLSLGVVGANAYLTLLAFQQSLIAGVTCLVLLLPLGSLIGIIAVRVILESVLCIFRIVVHMETLMDQIHTLRGQTASIADRVEDLPLPRIQFWRPRKRAESPDA